MSDPNLRLSGKSEAETVPEFVTIQFEQWWTERHLPAVGTYAHAYHMARAAWIEAYKRGLDVNY